MHRRPTGHLEQVPDLATDARLAEPILGQRADHAAPEGERRAVLLVLDDLPLAAVAAEQQLRSRAAGALRPDWVFVNERLLPRRGPLAPLFGDSRSCAYEVADPQRARDLLRRGLSAVETFRADTLLQELGLYR